MGRNFAILAIFLSAVGVAVTLAVLKPTQSDIGSTACADANSCFVVRLRYTQQLAARSSLCGMRIC